MATKSEELVKKIEAELTCAICLDQFNDPKVLPCLHTYCRKCVESLVERSLQPVEGDSSIVCPQCREENVLPKGGAEKLLTSFRFTNLVQVLEVHKADQSEDGGKTLTCDNGLDTNPATARCLDCDAYLCRSCLDIHKKQISLKKHTTVTLDEIKEKGDKCFHRPQYCIKHDKEVLKLYCRTCSEPICGDCTYVDHRTHEYVFLSDVQDELKKMLTKKVTSLKGVVELAKDKKEKLDALMEKHKENVVNVHAEIDKTIKEQIVNLKKRQAELHEEVEEKAKQEEKTISTDNESAEFNLVRLASIIKFTERLLQTGNGAEIAAMASQSIEQCEKLEGVVKESEKHIQECDLLTWKVSGIQKINDDMACLKILNESPIRVFVEANGLDEEFNCEGESVEVGKGVYPDGEEVAHAESPEGELLYSVNSVEGEYPPEQGMGPADSLESESPQEQGMVPADSLESESPQEQGMVPADSLESESPQEQGMVPADSLESESPQEQGMVPADSLESESPQEQGMGTADSPESEFSWGEESSQEDG